jgi:hypothetical protein
MAGSRTSAASKVLPAVVGNEVTARKDMVSEWCYHAERTSGTPADHDVLHAVVKYLTS